LDRLIRLTYIFFDQPIREKHSILFVEPPPQVNIPAALGTEGQG
jgi:hypothetical protein